MTQQRCSSALSKQVTAIDLGTSNTCIARCTPDGTVSVLRPEGLFHSALGGAVPTLLLRRDGAPFLIGAAAGQEFGEASLEERRHYSLHSQFKPDIAVQEEARTHMEAFLRLLHTHTGGAQGGQLLVGIPCQAGNHYRQVLRDTLQRAGWENARFLQEPLGAIMHSMAAGVLPPSLAAQGVLTVDFGGGTCDLALLRRADVISRHGDMLYGGRLFDDLFWQLLLRNNPGLEQRLNLQNNSYYVHWIACRQMKEAFSIGAALHRDQAQTIRARWSVWDGHASHEESAYVENLSWDTFLRLAGEYLPSPVLLEQLRAHGRQEGLSPRAAALLKGDTRVDLISWFEDLLMETLDRAHGRGELPAVLLTGGSSSWPFVSDLVRQCMGEQVKIILSAEPYADIARGLSQYYYLSQRLQEGRTALQEELPAFMEQRIRQQAIRVTLRQGTEDLLRSCAGLLQDTVLLPEFRRFRDTGGSIRQLIDAVHDAASQQEHRLSGLIEEGSQRIARTMAAACRQELRAWFHQKGIPLLPEQLEQRWLGTELSSLLGSLSTELSRATLVPLRRLAENITTVLAPSLAVLFSSGLFVAPVTTLTLGLGGAAAMRWLHLDRKVVDKLLVLPLPRPLRQRLFAEALLPRRCEEQLDKFMQAVSDALIQQWNRHEDALLQQAMDVARKEIAALDLLNIAPQ